MEEVWECRRVNDDWGRSPEVKAPDRVREKTENRREWNELESRLSRGVKVQENGDHLFMMTTTHHQRIPWRRYRNQKERETTKRKRGER